MMNSQLVASINSLPPLPKTVQEIERAYADTHVNAKKIAAIIEQDPMVTADLLKLLNSAFYGLRKEISSIEQSVSMLGMKSVKDIVVSLSVRNMLRTNLTPYGLSNEEFAKISQYQSMLSQAWMQKIDPKKAEEIRILALLQEIGKIVISDELLKENEDTTFKAELDAGWEIREIEKNYIDATTAEVSSAMLKHWEFDDSFADIILWSDQPNQADADSREKAWVLRIASEIINVRMPFAQKSIKRGLNLAIKAGLPDTSLSSIVDEFASKWNA